MPDKFGYARSSEDRTLFRNQPVTRVTSRGEESLALQPYGVQSMRRLHLRPSDPPERRRRQDARAFMDTGSAEIGTCALPGDIAQLDHNRPLRLLQSARQSKAYSDEALPLARYLGRSVAPSRPTTRPRHIGPPRSEPNPSQLTWNRSSDQVGSGVWPARCAAMKQRARQASL